MDFEKTAAPGSKKVEVVSRNNRTVTLRFYPERKREVTMSRRFFERYEDAGIFKVVAKNIDEVTEQSPDISV